ncbi:MAG: hypothetical protein Q8O76_15035, partial [Chloroflexota bacterium]|nr:hypothetical protein [Chloroflexota bacterium]
ERAGVDCLNVSVGIPHPHLQASPSRRYAMGTFAHLAEAVKAQVKVPVVAVGRIQTGQVAEDILSQGKADMVAIARPLMCDPFWPKKVREGREAEIVVCDCCNVNCFSPIEKRRLPPDAPLCHFNPRLGREWEMPAPE